MLWAKLVCSKPADQRVYRITKALLVAVKSLRLRIVESFAKRNNNLFTHLRSAGLVGCVGHGHCYVRDALGRACGVDDGSLLFHKAIYHISVPPSIALHLGNGDR